MSCLAEVTIPDLPPLASGATGPSAILGVMTSDASTSLPAADESLRALQLRDLEILREFKRICETHSLRYYLGSGTLLGAVRHKGFIPWDDDIDVEMPRPDYDRFSALCATDLGTGFSWQSVRLVFGLSPSQSVLPTSSAA